MPKKYGVREFNRDASELMISLENQENTYTTKLGAVKNFILKLTVILVNSRQLGRDMGGIKKLRTKVIKLNAKIRKLDEKMNQFENKDEFEEIISSGPNMDLEKKKAREYRKFRILHESKAKDLLEKQGYELKIDEWANKESEDKEFRYIYNGLFGTNGKKELVKGPDRVFELILNINDAKKYISRTNGCIKEIIECCDELIKEPSNIERIAILEGNFNSMITLLNRYDKGSHNKIFLRVRVRMRVVRIAIVTFNKVAPLLEDMRSHFIRLEDEKRQETELNQKKFEKIYYDLNEQLKLSKLKIDEDVLGLQNLVKRYARSIEDIPDLDGREQDMKTEINRYEEQKSILQTIINCYCKIQNDYKSKNKKQVSPEIENLERLLNDLLEIYPDFYESYLNCECLKNLDSQNIESIEKANSVYDTLQRAMDDINCHINAKGTNIGVLEGERTRREEEEKGIAALLDEIGNEIKKLKDLTDGVSQQNIEGKLAKLRDEIFSINSLIDTIESCNENNIVNKANFIIEKWEGIDGKLNELDGKLNEIGLKPNLEIEGNGPEGMATNHGFKEKRVPQQSIETAENPIQFADIMKQNLEDLYNLLGALKSYDNGLIQEIKHKRDEVLKNIDAYSQWADNNGGYDKNPDLLSLTCSQGEKIEDIFKEARDVFTNMLSEIKIEESLFKLNGKVVLMLEQGLDRYSLLYSIKKALNENSEDIVQNLNKCVMALEEAIEERTKMTVLSNCEMERQPAKFILRGKETSLYYIPNLKLENAIECIARPGEKICVKLNIAQKELPRGIRMGLRVGKGLISKYFQYGLNKEENSIVNDALLLEYGKEYEEFKKSVLAEVLSYEFKVIIPKINNREAINGITITEVGIG